MTVWQIAAGSDGRDYTDRFIRHGMAFLGGKKQCAVMQNFVQVGDKVILKNGNSKISSVGIVVDRAGQYKGDADKEWLRDFDGWDLQSWCYVDWRKLPNPIENVTGLVRGTIKRVKQPQLIELADNIIGSYPLIEAYEAEPATTRVIEDDDLIAELVRLGLRAGAAEELIQAIRRIRILTRFYLNRDRRLTNEHDARTFLVVPLLIALGWAEQKIKIELGTSRNSSRGRVDIGCFGKPYDKRDDTNQCLVLIETKGLTHGLDYATSQARDYARNFPACRVIIVTNGYCYKAYERQGETFSTQPTAYLNIDNPRDRYPLDPMNIGGAFDVLRLLLPT